MAYFAFDLVPGLCVCSAGRKPGPAGAALYKSHGDISHQRILARRQMALRALGCLPWTAAYRRTNGEVGGNCAASVATATGLAGHPGFRLGRMGVFPG